MYSTITDFFLAASLGVKEGWVVCVVEPKGRCVLTPYRNVVVLFFRLCFGQLCTYSVQKENVLVLFFRVFFGQSPFAWLSCRLPAASRRAGCSHSVIVACLVS